MTRSELIDKLVIEKNIIHSVAEVIITEIFKSMTDTLSSGNRIEIRGFCSFEVREYGAYTARNPQTGLQIEAKPKKLKKKSELESSLLDAIEEHGTDDKQT